MVKTAISLPDETFEAAERLARRQRISRSELYATAISEYLQRHGDEALLERINAACAELDTRPDPFFRVLSTRALSPAEDW